MVLVVAVAFYSFFELDKCIGKDEEIMQTTVKFLNFRTDRSGQTVQTQIRLLLKEQSDQGLHCLLFHLHVFDKLPSGLVSLFEFKVNYSKVSCV